jgi:hypothetical protein
MTTSRTWSLLLIMTAIPVGLLILSQQDAGSGTIDAAIITTPLPIEAGTPDLGTPALPRREAPFDEPASIGDLLDKWWGVRGAEAKAEAVSRGISLSDASVVKPWGQIEGEVLRHFQVHEEERAALTKNYLRWDADPTVEDLAGRFPAGDTSKYDESVALAVSLMAEDWNSRIALEVDSLVGAIEQAKLEAFTLGRFRRAPLFLLKHNNRRTGHLLYSGAGTEQGWVFDYYIYAEDYPNIPAQKDLVKSLRKQRDKAIQAWVYSQ